MSTEESNDANDEIKRQALSSKEVFYWPEFKLFCDRAGIQLNGNTRSMTIVLDVEAALSVTQTYLPKGIRGHGKEED